MNQSPRSALTRAPAAATFAALCIALLTAVDLAACVNPTANILDEAGSSQSTDSPARPLRERDPPGPSPEFGNYANVQEKKAAFFEYMNARVQIANDDVWAERLFVLALQEKFRACTISNDDTAELVELAAFYKLEAPQKVDESFFQKLLRRVDVVPASLALAQAANESAWGTSRFAVEGKNFFGIWCYVPGCGFEPAARKPGARHEVRKFDSVLEGIRFYIHYINTSGAYRELRDIRADVRDEDEKPTGTQLAAGLLHYSARGEDYVKEVTAMIRQNNLARYSVRRSVAPINSAGG